MSEDIFGAFHRLEEREARKPSDWHEREDTRTGPDAGRLLSETGPRVETSRGRYLQRVARIRGA